MAHLQLSVVELLHLFQWKKDKPHVLHESPAQTAKWTLQEVTSTGQVHSSSKVWTWLLPPAGRSERLVHEKLHLDPFQDQIGSPGRGQRCQTRTRRAKPAHYFSGASITEGICWKTTLTSYNFWPCRKFLFWYMASDPQSCQYLLYSAKPSLWHICSYLWWNFCTFSSERRISRMFCRNLLHKQPNEHCRR